MTDSRQMTFVLGGTGRTGSLVAQKLIERGLQARTASRNGADETCGWHPGEGAYRTSEAGRGRPERRFEATTRHKLK